MMAIDFQEDDGSKKIDFELDFQEDESSGSGIGEKVAGGLDAAAAMFAGTPAQIAGGLYGLSTLLSGQGLDKANENMEKVQKSNFGFGQYQPMTKKGGEYAENVHNVLEKPVEWAGDVGEKIAGNEGRLAGELWTRSAMELIDPLVGVGLVARGAGKGKPKKKTANEKAADNLDFVEDTPATPSKRLDIDLTQGADNNADLAGDFTTDFKDKRPARLYAENKGIVTPGQPGPWLDVARERAREVALEQSRAAADKALAESAARVQQMHDADIQGRLQQIDEGVTGLEDREARLQNEDLVAKLQEAEATRGQNPVYVDPQGQAFRGDPNLQGARTAVDRQTAAMELELTHLQGKGTPEGEPLRPLRDVKREERMSEARWQRISEMEESLLKVEKRLALEADKAHKAAPTPAKPEGGGGLKSKPISNKGPIGRQRGAVNTALFDFNFTKTKELPGGFKMFLQGGARGPTIDMYDPEGRQIGNLDASPVWGDKGRDLEARFVKVDSEYKGKNLAKEMYKFLAEMGNDIKRSSDQLPPGRAMWDKFEREGLAKDGRIPRIATKAESNLKNVLSADAKTHIGGLGRGQRGGVTLDLLTFGMLPKKNPLRKMAKQDDGTFIPNDPTPEEVDAMLVKARGEKDGKSFANFDSGAHLTAAKRGSTAIEMLATIVGNAFKRADLGIRKAVFPAENALRKLSSKDMVSLGKVFKNEMMKGTRFTDAQLEAFSPDLLTAYRQMREMFDDSLRIQNEARAAKGQKPITPMEAYLSSRWIGDFRRPIYDTKGKPVWYLAAETKAGLNAQTRALLKDHPDLVYDPKKDHTVRFSNRKTDLESAYTTMLDILGRDDPAVDTLRQYMESETVGRGATFLNQEKHFKAKGNVRGFVGDRPEIRVNDLTDKTVPIVGEMRVANSEKSEMLAMFQQQIQYAKNAYRWSELQKASQSVKKIVNDPELNENQPKNTQYMRDYFKHAIGYGESRATRAIADSLRDFGVSPEPFDRGVGGIKSYFILSKLGFSIPYAMAQSVQLSFMLPHMVDVMVKDKFVGNFPKAISAGLLGGLAMGSGHTWNGLTGGSRVEKLPGSEFFNRAYKYAEENGITARSIYDESPIGDSFSPIVGNVAKAAKFTITTPETYLRATAFMTMAQFLKDSGKFKTEKDVFQEAERRVNMAMVDYAQTERPMVFAKLGSAGNFLNTLQTFAFNYYNQLSYFYREAKRGNPAPLLAHLAIQAMIGGAMGVPYMEDAYKALMNLKDQLPASAWKKMQDNEFIRDPKLWAIKNFGESSVYGALSDQSGLGITSRVAAPTGGQMLTSPAGPITELGKQAMSVGKLALDPTNTTKQAQAAMDLSPPGLAGLIETAPFMEGITHNRRPDGTAAYVRQSKLAEPEALTIRTPEEERLRKFGFRSQREVAERDINYSIKRDEVAAERHAREVPKAFYDAVQRGDEEKAREHFKTYTYITGNQISPEQFENMVKKEHFTNYERLAEKVGKSRKPALQDVIALKRATELYEKIRREEGGK